MLAIFRNNMKKISLVIVIAFCLTMFTGTFFLRGGGESDRTNIEAPTDAIAMMGTIPVSGRKFYNIYQEINQSLSQQDRYYRPSPEMDLNRWHIAFQRALEFALFLEGAKQQDIRIGRSEMKQYLGTIFTNLNIRKKSELKKILAQHNMPYDFYIDRLKENIMVSKIQGEIETIQITDQNIHDFYTELEVSHILIPINDTTVEVAQEKIKQLRDDLLRGHLSFSQAALQFSSDTGSSQKGGALGWVRYDSLVESFSKAAFQLTKDVISQPVKTPYGFHLIKVTDRRAVKSIDDMEKERKNIANIRINRRKSQFFYQLSKGSDLVFMVPYIKAIYAWQNQEIDNAIAAFNESVAQQPNSPLPHYFLAQLYTQKDDAVQTEKELKKAMIKNELAIEKWPSVPIAAGNFYRSRNRSKMWQHYDKAFEMSQQNLTALEALDSLYETLGAKKRRKKVQARITVVQETISTANIQGG